MANQYFTCELEAWRSGTTLYGRMHYYRTDGQTYTYTDTSFPTPTMDLAGSTYSDTDFANRVHAGINIGNVYSTTFSRSVAGSGNRTVTWTAGSGGRSDFAGTWSETVYFPPSYVAPTTPTISATVTSPTSITITYGTTSFGNPATGTVTLYGGTTASPTTSIDTTNTTGDKTYTFTGLSPETTYYFRAKANNGQLDSDYSTEISVTTPLDKGLYGSVNGEAKKVEKLYGPAEKLDSLSSIKVGSGNGYISVFYQNTFLNAFLSEYPSFLWKDHGELQSVTIVRGASTRYNMEITTTIGTLSVPGLRTTDLSNWGITPAASSYEYVELTPSYILAAKEITKLYGSVNGQTKRIF